MITELPESEGSVVGFKITGAVTLKMEKEWIAKLEKVIQEHGKFSVLIFLDEHASWGLKAGIKDLKWLLTHFKKMEKVAIVADSNFWKWYGAVVKPFGKIVGIDEKYFKPADLDTAWKWLKE